MLRPLTTAARRRVAHWQRAGRALLGRWWPAIASGLRRDRAREDLADTAPFAKHVALSPDVEPRALSARLVTEKQFLLQLIGGMEAEFLATGDGLAALAQRLAKIQQPSQALSDLTLGHSTEAALPSAFALFDQAEALVTRCHERYDHVFSVFTEVQQRMRLLATQHQALMRILRPLEFITACFRIESVSHPLEVREAFFTLADTVNHIVTEVRDTMDRQFAELAASELAATTLMQRIILSIKDHQVAATATLRTGRAHLQALHDALSHSGASAADLVELHRAINRHIGHIVMAQQCQDITRQQIEHVGEAMEEMRAHLAVPSTTAPVTKSEPRAFILRASQIQHHQVRNVFDQLTAAAVRLTSGIEGLRQDAEAAAAAAVRVGGTTLDAHIGERCQAGIGEILGVTDQSVRRVAEIIAVFAPLQASFMDCTGQATTLASDVRYAGLNAQIYAAHAPNGASLAVLAASACEVSDEVIAHVAEMHRVLDHTTTLVATLREHLEQFQIEGGAEQEKLASAAGLSQQKLAGLERVIPALVQQVTFHQGEFTAATQEVLGHVRFPATVAAASSRALEFFDELVAWGRADPDHATGGTSHAPTIDRLTSRYTMESERIAHAAALGALTATTAAAVSIASIPAPEVTLAQTCSANAGLESASSNPNAAASPAPDPAPELVSTNTPRTPSEYGDNVDLF